jgi:hypothetical protein
MTPAHGYISTYSGKLEVKGTGVVAIQQQGRKQVLLHNVLYVPSSPHPIGLISIGQEQDKGATVSGHGSTLTLTLADGSSIVGSKFRKFSQTPSTLFSVQATTNPPAQQIIERAWYAQQQAHEPSSKEQRSWLVPEITDFFIGSRLLSVVYAGNIPLLFFRYHLQARTR